jgi:hypothetical protein
MTILHCKVCKGDAVMVKTGRLSMAIKCVGCAEAEAECRCIESGGLPV